MTPPPRSAPAHAPSPAAPPTRWLLALALVVLVAGAALLGFLRLDPRYFWDDRFSFYNVERLVVEGRVLPDWYYWYAPPSYLPQAWAVRVSNAVAAAGGGARWLAYDAADGDFTRFGIRLMRAFGIAYGGMALLLLAALGRQLTSARAAAVAALVFATSPWAIYGIAGFKPDPLLLLATLACLVALGDFLRDGQPRWYWIGAALLGVATAAKLNGALLAVPVALAALLGDGGWRRRLGRLAGGGVLAVAVELALNPFPAETLRFLGRVDRLYDTRSFDAEAGPLAMVGALLALLARPNFLGTVLAAAALAGLALVSVRAGRDRGGPAARAWALPVAFALGNLIFLAATSRYAKQNHLLQLLPIAALLAAVAIEVPLAALARRRPRLAVVALAAFAAVLGVRAASFVGEQLVPAPPERLLGELRRELGGGSGRAIAWLSRGEAPPVTRSPRGVPPLVVAFDPRRLPATEELARFDCLAGDGAPPAELAAPLRRRFAPSPVARPPLAERWIPGRDVRLWRGCAPWEPAGEAVELKFEPEAAGRWRVALPLAAPPHEAISLELRVLPPGAERPRLVAPGGELPLEYVAGGRRAGAAWRTLRVAPQAPGTLLELALAAPSAPVRCLLTRWRAPAPPG